jgi:hypothetical protein
VLYNGQGQDDAQAYTAAGEHRHAGFLSGFKSVALVADGYTRQSNQLVFDDSTGRLRTKFATDTDMDNGGTSNYTEGRKFSKSSLTEAEAIALWDTVSRTLRPRPGAF